MLFADKISILFSYYLFAFGLFFLAVMQCQKCDRVLHALDTHPTSCVFCCGCSQGVPCSVSELWPEASWKQVSFIVSSETPSAHGGNFRPSKSMASQKNLSKVAASGDSRSLPFTHSGVGGLTQGPRPTPSIASASGAKQGVLGNPCPKISSESMYRPNLRQPPYRFVNSDRYITNSRYPNSTLFPDATSHQPWSYGDASYSFYPYSPWQGWWGGMQFPYFNGSSYDSSIPAVTAPVPGPVCSGNMSDSFHTVEPISDVSFSTGVFPTCANLSPRVSYAPPREALSPPRATAVTWTSGPGNAYGPPYSASALNSTVGFTVRRTHPLTSRGSGKSLGIDTPYSSELGVPVSGETGVAGNAGFYTSLGGFPAPSGSLHSRVTSLPNMDRLDDTRSVIPEGVAVRPAVSAASLSAQDLSGNDLAHTVAQAVIRALSRDDTSLEAYDPADAPSEDAISSQGQASQPFGDYHETLEEVHSLLGDLCPRADDTLEHNKRVLSTLEQIFELPSSSSPSLPQSSSVQKLVEVMLGATATGDRSKPDWTLSSKVLASLTNPRSYVCHSEYWPGDLPKLDVDAGRLGINAGKSASVKVSTLETLERLARRVVNTASHCDYFTAAAFRAGQTDQVDPDQCKRLLLAVSRSAKHNMALGVALSAILMHQRRNSALNSSNLLFPHNKGLLRAAPLDSNNLFAGNINEVLAVNMTDRQHSALKNIALQSSYPPQSSIGTVPRKRQNQKPSSQMPLKKVRLDLKPSPVPTPNLDGQRPSKGRGGSFSGRGALKRRR